MSENGDGLDYLRIPFEKIKFGKKLEGHGYGSVFEGEFGDRRVALKQLNITNLGNIKPKLLAEILTISRFRQHPNLVALLGFCDERSNEIILVYEFVASGNLADKMRNRLNTIQRFEICLGAARGLDYLHTGVDSTTPGIVHGHVKLSKILLNSDSNSSKFEAKVSSFGLSKIVPGKAQPDPEDEVNDKATKESDVYSFGVLLLEVLCGVSELVDTDDYQERHVSELVPKRLEQDKLRKIVHFDIRREIKTEALQTYAKIACQCVIETPEARPTMTQVVEQLEKALRLQGGEVTYVHIPSSENINGAQDGTVEDPRLKGDDETVDSKAVDEEPQEPEIVKIEEDAKEVIFDVAGEVNGDEISKVDKSSESINGEKNSEEDITVQQRSFDASILDSVNGESLPDSVHIEDDQKESNKTVITSTNDQVATEEIADDLNSNEEPNVAEDDNQSKTDIEDTEREISNTVITSTNDPETTEEIINDLSSIEESNTAAVNEDDNESKNQSEDTKKESCDVVIMSTNDPESTEEITDNSDSKVELNITDDNDQSKSSDAVIMSTNYPETTEDITNDSNSKAESNITEENNQSKIEIEDAQKSSSNNVITNTNDPETTEEIANGSNSKEELNFGIQESGNRLWNEVGDGLDDLRIPYQKIKFGKKIDIDGYGSMFEGEFDDQQVALKRLNITNLGNVKPKLLSEILNIARFKNHPNLVALIGFCDEKSNEIIIVYEYISGGNLADSLSKHLTTIQRLEICLGAARGVDHLHSGLSPAPGIIHGDIKLSKILLHPDSISSKLEAKVSGFGLSKLLPGKSQTNLDPEHKTKESDVYSFGVLLLEVLCGVPELVDTDDYQERHVTELVPKRLEQNLLRKIVHFDIRDEIRTEALETYAKIACQCVVEDPEARPTMGRVVEELEKALRLQAGEVSEVQVLQSINGNGLPEGNVVEDDREGDDDETMGLNTAKEEFKVIKEADIQAQSFPVNGDSVPDITDADDAKKESNEHVDDPENIEETITDIHLYQESNTILENELEIESNIPLIPLESNNGDIEKVEQENGNILPTSSHELESKEETMDDKITPMEITMEAHTSEENGDSKIKLHGTKKEPDATINTREVDFSNFSTTNSTSIGKTDLSESKRSNSTSSESSNGDGTTPSDSLLQKDSPNGRITKKTTYGSRSCCSCSWWNVFSNRVASCGGQFWNKSTACCTCIGGRFSSKHD